MQRLFKSALIIVVLAFTLPFVTYWIPSSVLTPILAVVIGLGVVCAILLVPVWLFLTLLNTFKGS